MHELSDTLEHLPALVLRLDPEGKAVYLNKHWTSISGINRSSLLDSGWQGLLHTSDTQHLRALTHEDSPKEVLFRIRSGDEQFRWHVFRAATSQSGTLLIGVEADTTITQKFASDRIAAEFERTLEQIPAMIWRTRPDGYLDYANRRWLDFWGQELKDAVGWGWRDGVHPDDREGIEAYWRYMLLTGAEGQYEARVGNSRLGYRWCVSIGTPCKDQTGNIVAWYGAIFDIEERKHAENKLQVSEAYLKRGQELSKIGSFGFELDTDGLFWSDETYRILEYDVETKPSFGLLLSRIHEEDRPGVERLRQELRNGSPEIEGEFRLKFDDGRVKHLRVLGQKSQPLDTAYTAVIMDVTAAIRNAERLKQNEIEIAHVARVATAGELAASIAHEVNQPLGALVASGGALLRWIDRDEPDIEKATANARRMVGYAQLASDIVARVRTLFERGSTTLEAVDCFDLLSASFAYVESSARRNGVEIILDVEHGIPPIQGDPVQLQQVIINLMVNAVQALSQHKKSDRLVRISARLHNDAVEIDCLDNGPGFAGDGEQFFKPFHTTKQHGIGMGLAICRSIVEAHDGKISARANPSGGAAFHVKLPVNPQPTNPME
ncbi:PAS domain-containing sensor histidine kinase [Phyllobacterium chamaecytisi]|uniref:PAS domain-containing sensor histidine kinase n=1 Tax=Phyllobacterium chamaecytisi TaxID=2876082 RepID=UPI001CC8FCE5|nr:PAS domain-containing sensor histidine kinase [Phyllobacterium sp. KW56]MBZ9601395.1 PAS domain S-box protein [Phyllobacterium sp. KW56]